MRKLISLFAFWEIIFLAGCHSNIPIDPNSTPTNKTNVQFELHDRINICCEICDPISGVCSLEGIAEYVHQIIEAPENPDCLYTIMLTLEMNSQIYDRCMRVHLPWIAEGTSTHTVYVSEEGIALVDRGYLISNRNDIMLCVQYLVTTEGVGIPNIWIQEIDSSI